MSMVDEAPQEDLVIPLKFGLTIPLSTTRVTSDPHYRQALTWGFQKFLVANMSKITKSAYPDDDERNETILKIAQDNLEALYSGSIKLRGAARESSKVPRDVMKLARGYARQVVVAALKEQGYKSSVTRGKTVTRLTNALLASNPIFIERARKEMEELNKIDTKSVDLSSLTEDDIIDAKKVRAQKERKAAKVISATQASRVATRTRPQA